MGSGDKVYSPQCWEREGTRPQGKGLNSERKGHGGT